MEARNFKTARLAYCSLYEVDIIQCDSKGLTALSGLMSRTAEGLHGKPVTFKIEKIFLLNK